MIPQRVIFISMIFYLFFFICWFVEREERSPADSLFNWINSMANKNSETINLETQKVSYHQKGYKELFLKCIEKIHEWGLYSQEDAIEALQCFINGNGEVYRMLHTN